MMIELVICAATDPVFLAPSDDFVALLPSDLLPADLLPADLVCSVLEFP